MLYRGIIAVCSDMHTRHINTLSVQNLNFLLLNLVAHILTTMLQRLILMTVKQNPSVMGGEI
jgi:hypothetical protein